MQLSQPLILRLRGMASRGAAVRAMVDEIRDFLGTSDGLALVADRYFKEAFSLTLSDVRPIEGSTCLGGKVYSDEEINRLMLPRIESTRHLWEPVLETDPDLRRRIQERAEDVRREMLAKHGVTNIAGELTDPDE